MAGEISIKRGLEEIKDGLAGIKSESAATDKELRAVNAALKEAPNNAELLARKQELLAEKLKLAQEQSALLKEKTEELRAAMEGGEYATDAQKKKLAEYELQLKTTQYQITGLNTATQEKIAVDEVATETTNTLKGSMTEFTSALSLATQASRGLNSLYTLMGGSGDSTFGKMLKIIPSITMAVKGVAAAMKLAAIATGSWKSALTLGVAAVAIVAGIVAIEKAVNKSTAEIPSASASDVSSSISSASTTRTPTVSSYAGSVSGGATTYISQGGLTEGQMEMASYKGFVRAIVETGLNDKQFIGNLNINGRQLAETTFNDFLDVNDRRTRGFATK